VPVKPERVEHLTNDQLSGVLTLVMAATGTDGVAPLSEQVLLAARDNLRGSAGTSEATARSSDFLTYAGDRLAGYAHLEAGGSQETGEAATAEVVVDPSYRRQGIGAGLLRALEDALAPGAALSLWSHGDLESARALARRGGYSAARELWQMRRSLRSGVAPLPAVNLPEGFKARHFVVGQDEEAWLGVNARAFVNHPEQGRMTRSDLEQRIAEPWFDAQGLILVEDTRPRRPVLAASHWTKVVPGNNPADPADPALPPQEGEVYVVGVDPAYQGLGLGRTVTILGLAHLRDRGLSEATLYVDGDNRAAVATYSRLDFARFAVDIMYSRIVHPTV
jgi:mycothiol synthase